MTKNTRILIVVGFFALIAFILYSTTGLDKVSCEVCMEFHGATSCRPAAGTTRQEAIRTAVTIACSDIASGRADSIVCEGSPPKSTKCMD